MPGRVVSIQFRGAPREVVYTTRGNEPDGLTCRFADIPYGEAVTEAEWADIYAICLTDLRERRAEWRAQILRRRIVPGLRRKKWR